MSSRRHLPVRVAPPGRPAMSLVVLALAFGLLLILAPDVLLVIFAGLLFGVFLGAGGGWIARLTGIGQGWAIGLFVLASAAALAGAYVAFAPSVANQLDSLARELPSAIERLRESIESREWAEDLLDRVAPASLLPEGGGGTAATAVSTTFGALGNMVIIFFIGLYVAVDPGRYRRGLLSLLAPSVRPAGRIVLARAVNTLRHWLAAQLMAMTVVGVLTGFGLWLVGVPLAPVLGLIAALLAFIPNIGPIIAATPGVLLAFSQGTTTVLLVIGVYVGVQTLESYLITPLIQQEQVSLPPALVISAQLLMGVLFGLIGLALATPLAALTMALVEEVYVRRFLDREAHRGEEVAPPARPA